MRRAKVDMTSVIDNIPYIHQTTHELRRSPPYNTTWLWCAGANEEKPRILSCNYNIDTRDMIRTFRRNPTALVQAKREYEGCSHASSINNTFSEPPTTNHS